MRSFPSGFSLGLFKSHYHKVLSNIRSYLANIDYNIKFALLRYHINKSKSSVDLSTVFLVLNLVKVLRRPSIFLSLSGV